MACSSLPAMPGSGGTWYSRPASVAIVGALSPMASRSVLWAQPASISSDAAASSVREDAGRRSRAGTFALLALRGLVVQLGHGITCLIGVPDQALLLLPQRGHGRVLQGLLLLGAQRGDARLQRLDARVQL